MKEFHIIESRPTTVYWKYIVKANNEQEALDIVLEGETDATEMWVDEDDMSEMDDRESEFSVYPADDDNK
jgi:hypothetical protein